MTTSQRRDVLIAAGGLIALAGCVDNGADDDDTMADGDDGVDDGTDDTTDAHVDEDDPNGTDPENGEFAIGEWLPPDVLTADTPIDIHYEDTIVPEVYPRYTFGVFLLDTYLPGEPSDVVFHETAMPTIYEERPSRLVEAGFMTAELDGAIEADEAYIVLRPEPYGFSLVRGEFEPETLTSVIETFYGDGELFETDVETDTYEDNVWVLEPEEGVSTAVTHSTMVSGPETEAVVLEDTVEGSVGTAFQSLIDHIEDGVMGMASGVGDGEVIEPRFAVSIHPTEDPYAEIHEIVYTDDPADAVDERITFLNDPGIVMGWESTAEYYLIMYRLPPAAVFDQQIDFDFELAADETELTVTYSGMIPLERDWIVIHGENVDYETSELTDTGIWDGPASDTVREEEALVDGDSISIVGEDSLDGTEVRWEDDDMSLVIDIVEA